MAFEGETSNCVPVALADFNRLMLNKPCKCVNIVRNKCLFSYISNC